MRDSQSDIHPSLSTGNLKKWPVQFVITNLKVHVSVMIMLTFIAVNYKLVYAPTTTKRIGLVEVFKAHKPVRSQ